jgi:acetyl esterase/lipase
MSTWLLAAALLLGAAPDLASVRIVRDVAYIPDRHDAQGKDRLDLYLPAGGTGSPVIVWIHGGALQEGDRTQETAIGRRFAAAGIAAAVVSYRLSPAVRHPAHVQDVAASVAWVKRHIAEHGGDPGRIFLAGHSAGAYLAALLSTDERYLAIHGISPRDIRGVVPVSAFFWVERAGVAPDRPKTVWGTDPQVWIDASPAHHLRPAPPPMLILYADGDESWRRQQNVEMAQALKDAASPPADLVQIPDRSHMSIWEKLPQEGDPTAERIIAFVKSFR